MRIALILLSFLLSQSGFAATDTAFALKSLPLYDSDKYDDPSVSVAGTWKYCKGDNAIWADSAFDDSGWKSVYPSLPMRTLPAGTFEGKCWLRRTIIVDQSLCDRTLALLVTQAGASEIYLDGKLIHRFGKIDNNAEERYDPQLLPVDITFRGAGAHIIAVRYHNANAVGDFDKGLSELPGFEMKFSRLRDYTTFHYVNSNILSGIFTFYFTFFSVLSFLHLIIFLYNRSGRANLFYSIFAGSFGLIFVVVLVSRNFMDPDVHLYMEYLSGFLPDIYAPALIAMLYTIFYGRMLKVFWLWMALFATDFVLTVFHVDFPVIGLIAYGVFCIETLRVIIAAIISKKEGSWIIGSGVIVTVVFLAVFLVLGVVGGVSFNFTAGDTWSSLLFGLLVIYVTLSIPISMTVYLARDFAKTSRSLARKLVEVEELSEKSIQQEKEKQRILETQNEVLEEQVTERTHEITEQKKVIEEKNKDITDSIVYAKRIQDALLPSSEFVARLFPANFILFRPKDIVSGDFYWAAHNEDRVYFAVVDCTGHGVPGALMSMIGSNILDHIVNEKKLTRPSEILDQLHEDIVSTLKQREDTDRKDGMDIALIAVQGNTLSFAGAHRPLWIIRGGELIEYKGNKLSIGGTHHNAGEKFAEHRIELHPGDSAYLFSDGYADQFGGESGKKFMTKRMKELLVRVATLSMPEQKREIEAAFQEWMGGASQVDDILVVGVRL